LKACWLKIIKVLKEILDDVNTLSVKKGELYFKFIELDLLGTIEEVSDPKLILNSLLMTREQFQEHLEILNGVSTEKFNCMTEYSEHEVKSWLVSYVNKNEEIKDSLHKLSIDLRELESTLFDIKVINEITISSMREYKENWLKQSLIKIT